MIRCDKKYLIIGYELCAFLYNIKFFMRTSILVVALLFGSSLALKGEPCRRKSQRHIQEVVHEPLKPVELPE
jgi:hypothetical protein